DILRFARDERIPVVALNIRKEIVGKISRSGIDSLTEDEKKELPESMDMTDESYKGRLKEIFENHESSRGSGFENFYQSQIVWDETMAESIAEYLRKNPDRQMIVIAGAGHLFFGSGIPKRTYRRNGADYAVVVQDASPEIDIADFILFPQPVKAPASPKIGVILQEEKGRVKIAGFASTSIAEKAGMREDDILLSLDDTPVKHLEDVQIFFLYKKKGDAVKIRALRKRFLFGEKELAFDVTL
ncbi:MAG TPA: ChaN family lipoprotein, partial [Thermodesulfovibrionales bacterium]|nr:ChaN family lipoprotein [Thermodesulfovibrionales bacterium]